MPTVKTLFLYEAIPEETMFFELDGDHSQFDGVYINMEAPKGVSKTAYKKLQDELEGILFVGVDGTMCVTELEEPTRDWTHFVKCGFYL